MITENNIQSGDSNIPLVVDLDGTLIYTDLLYEGVILLVKRNLFNIFLCFRWFLKGKIYLKNKVFEKVQIRSDLLPYNGELLRFLQVESDNGRKLILATASLKMNALEISKLYPIFNGVFGTENKINLKGEQKRQKLITEFGEGKFDYIGNSYADLKIFASSRYSYLVNPTNGLEKRAKKISNLKFTWKNQKNTFWSYLKAIRAYQWVKNLLIFVPLITSHSFHSFNPVLQALQAFLAFSLVASSGYLINDLSDLNSDRSHPRKKYRPLASGDLSILSGCILSCVLLVSGLVLASSLSSLFFFITILYFLTSVTYSLYLKKLALYDVFILALLYSVRVFAGGVVIDVTLSFWLIAFSTFIFLSLAMVKRYSELVRNGDETSLSSRGRQYTVDDLQLLQNMGIVSGFLSVVVFSLYINSAEVIELYSKPKILWAMSFLFLFWISRIWLYTIRGKMTDDPIIFAVKDTTSYFLFLFIGVIIMIAI